VLTGAGGRVGSQVVRLLAGGSGHEIVALGRRELHLPELPGRVSSVVADYADRRALRAGLRGVDTRVFVSSDGPVAQMIVHHHNVIQAAMDSGVRHIVALSGLDSDIASPFCYGYTEQLLQEAGCGFSIARASIYTEFFLGILDQLRVGAQLRVPAGSGRISLVSRGDIANCLAALAVTPAAGGHHEITGPEALDMDTIAALAAQEWRTPVEYVELSADAYSRELANAGEDPWWVYAYASMFASIREHRWASVSDQVTELTGRHPATVRKVLTQTRA
jgi:NAD(P)H dehydrogenase (quinone)